MVNLSLLFLTMSNTFNLPPGLLNSICYIESAHKINAINLDDGGSPSLGLCQIKKSTARFLGYKGSAKKLWLNPEINVYYAAKLLRYQLDRYNQNEYKAISAYNMGTFKRNKHGIPYNKSYITKVYNAWKPKK